MPTPPNTSMVLSQLEIEFINRYYNGSKSAAIHKAMEILMQTYDYTVLEDNGGGLHLFLFHPGSDTPVTGFTDFEYTPGSLIESLDALDAGDDASTWDGRMGDVAGMWQAYLDSEFGYAVICYGENGQRTVKPEKMGRAGQIEFGTESA